MALEAALVVVVAVLTVGLMVRREPAGIPWRVAGLTVVGLAFSLAAVSFRTAATDARAAVQAAALPAARGEDFVTSSPCRACHPAEWASWYATYHRTMTQAARPEAVLAPFAGETVSNAGRTYKLTREGDRFWAESSAGRREIVMVTGSHHQQRFWIRDGRARELDLLPFGFLLRERQWVPGEALFTMPQDDLRSEDVGLWNRNCVTCHRVAGAPRVGAAPGSADTRVAELGIGCEACHGPGKRHVELQRNPITRYRTHFADDGDHTIINPKRLPAKEVSQVCGQCHGVFVFSSPSHWREHGPDFRAGGQLASDRFMLPGVSTPGTPQPPAGFRESRFWSDGMVRVSGREFTAMVASACYLRSEGALSCLSCHRMHGADPNDQLRADRTDDAACQSCHADLVAAPAAHTHHAADSSGSRCQNCHMPYTTLGLLSTIRSHQITNPSVRESAEVARPNACNLCHLDRTLAWTQAALGE